MRKRRKAVSRRAVSCLSLMLSMRNMTTRLHSTVAAGGTVGMVCTPPRSVIHSAGWIARSVNAVMGSRVGGRGVG
eukprot:1109344-Prorocentrum_minimum.AAC.1